MYNSTSRSINDKDYEVSLNYTAISIKITQVCGSAFVANATSLHVMNVTVSQVS